MAGAASLAAAGVAAQGGLGGVDHVPYAADRPTVVALPGRRQWQAVAGGEMIITSSGLSHGTHALEASNQLTAGTEDSTNYVPTDQLRTSRSCPCAAAGHRAVFEVGGVPARTVKVGAVHARQCQHVAAGACLLPSDLMRCMKVESVADMQGAATMHKVHRCTAPHPKAGSSHLIAAELNCTAAAGRAALPGGLPQLRAQEGRSRAAALLGKQCALFDRLSG